MYKCPGKAIRNKNVLNSYEISANKSKKSTVRQICQNTQNIQKHALFAFCTFTTNVINRILYFTRHVILCSEIKFEFTSPDYYCVADEMAKQFKVAYQ